MVVHVLSAKQSVRSAHDNGSKGLLTQTLHSESYFFLYRLSNPNPFRLGFGV